MDGLTQSYIFKQKLQNCEPIDLSRFVVDLRERHLEYWILVTLFWNSPEKTHQQTLYLPPVVCVLFLLQKGLWSLIRLTSFRVHVSQPASWCHLQYSLFQTSCLHLTFWDSEQHEINVTPPLVTCVILMVSMVSSMFFSTAPIPTWFLCAGNMHICFPQQEPTMCLLAWVWTITSFIFPLWTSLFMSRLVLAVALLDGRPFFVILVNLIWVSINQEARGPTEAQHLPLQYRRYWLSYLPAFILAWYTVCFDIYVEDLPGQGLCRNVI